MARSSPASPEWKDKLKLATRRIRLLMVYTPDRLKTLQDAESKDRKAADDLLRPATTQPTVVAATQPAAAPGDDTTADNFRVDWHDVTKDIQYDMLWDALIYAEKQYYRQVSFQGLLNGGLNGLKAVVTTKGLEDAFQGLKDPDKSKQFLDAIDGCLTDAKAPRRIRLKASLANRSISCWI